MFNLFEEDGEPLTEGAKFRFPMDKVNYQELHTFIEALRARGSLEAGRATTFTEAANVLAASVSSLPETVAKSRISGLSQLDTGASNDDIIYWQGNIFTGYYKFFNKPSKEDQGKILAERERLNIKKGSSEKKNHRNASALETKEVASMRKRLKKANSKIYALERAQKDNSEANSDNETASHNPGTSFGGRNEKRNKKQSS